MKEIQKGVFQDGNRIYTENLVPGKCVYGEDLIQSHGKELREWIPKRSKLAATILKGMQWPSMRRDSSILYLGAATGTTTSHISDICSSGTIMAIEFSPEVFIELFMLSRFRANIVPILADAAQPERYYFRLVPVDLVYQDIAQRNQVEIFEQNCSLFLKKSGMGLLLIKSRSIDVAKHPKKVFLDVKQRLQQSFRILDYRTLHPFQRDHAAFLVTRK